jgi:hypothetical protein
VSTSVFHVRNFSNFVSGGAAFVSETATAISNKHFFAHGVPGFGMLAAQKCKRTIKMWIQHTSGLRSNGTPALERYRFVAAFCGR